MALHIPPRRAGALALVAAAAAAAACRSDNDVRGITAPAATNAGIMLRYVALGNSLTAGYQSGGITDSTQRASYPNLLAVAAGVRFAWPGIAGRGCAPPIVNFVSGVRVGGDTSSTICDGRLSTSLTDQLNNVAVPGANSFDPTAAPAVTVGSGATAVTYTGGYSALTRTLLGNRTQVQVAIATNPTFASIWIGNNDVLSFALNGDTARVVTNGVGLGPTPVSNFTRNYAAMVSQLTAGSPGLQGGVLIGVVDVTAAPLLVPLALFVPGSAIYSPLVVGTASAALAGGRTLVAGPNCTVNTTALVAFPALASTLSALARAIPSPAPIPVPCGPLTLSPTVTVGTAGFLDTAEVRFYRSRITAYNTYVAAKADSLGWIYFNPNTALADLRTRGLVPLFPNLAVPTRPFGLYISNDGVHPGTAAHQLLADSLRLRINAKYGTAIPKPDSTGR